MNKYLSKYGFTLVELMVTIAALSIVTILAFSIFFSGLKYSNKAETETSMQQEMNILLTSITKFHESENSYEIITDKNPNADSITIRSDSGLKSTNFSNSNFSYTLYNYQGNTESLLPQKYSVVSTNNPLYIKIVITNKTDPSQTYEVKTIISRL